MSYGMNTENGGRQLLEHWLGPIVLLTVGSLLAGLILPGSCHWGDGMMAAKKTVSRQRALAIKVGIEQYRIEYQRWPTTDDAPEADFFEGEEYDRLASALCAVGSGEDLAIVNPKKIVYLEANLEEEPLGDYWGNPFGILIDHDDDGEVLTADGTVVHEAVLVWSLGPNGKDEGGAGDDLISWDREVDDEIGEANDRRSRW